MAEFDSKLYSDSFLSYEYEFDTYSSMRLKNLQRRQEIVKSISNRLLIKSNANEVIDELTKQSSKYEDEKHARSILDLKTDAAINIYKKNKRNTHKECNKIERELKESLINSKELSLKREEFRINIQKKNSALKEATGFYKRNLKIHVKATKQSDAIFVVQISYFSEIFSNNNSVTVTKNFAEHTWELTNVNPKILPKQYSTLKERLKETGDIVGFVCAVRKIFLLQENSRI